ncbi:DUF4123 domain-containing protein [Aquitalea denitrificans]|uniref:DUF4123 domain-containing protein n=1 Tax=Aquitalea denitrificans TaxID=519081 RepID=UPI00135C7D47|nr:DUF4123 domain-containing protein [Aquitalea denitrificans]
MLHVQKTKSHTTAEWLDELLTQLRQEKQNQLFAMIDLADDKNLILQTIRYHSTEPAHRLLLDNTAHQSVAVSGPVLIAINTEQQPQVKLLLELMQIIENEPRLIFIIAQAHINLDQLAQRLTQATQVELEDGLLPMIFRFYDPRCLHIALSNLSPAEFKFVFEPIHSIHWQDRDGVSSRINRPTDFPSLPDWPHQVLHLSDGSVQALSAWHQAEKWQQTHEATADKFGLPNKEAMMQLLYQMQLLADEESLLSEPERNAFIDEKLQNTGKTNNHLKGN